MKRILLFTMMCLFGLFSLNAQETISIGNGDVENYNVPIEAYYLCSYSQQSYSKDEIAAAGGEAGTITSIQYNVKRITTEITTRKIRVFIENVETEQEITFNSNTKKYHQLSNLDGLVYEGDYTFTDGWNEIVFQTPFVYTGNHILITVLNDTKDSDNLDIYFAIHNKSEYVDGTAVNWTANGNSGDVIDPTAIQSGNPNAVRNDIKLTFAEDGEGGGEEPTPEPEEPVTVTIGDGSKTTANAPINNQGSYGYSYSQQIYLKDEIGKEEGLITSIAFHNNVGGPNTRNIVVLMNNTEKASYAGTQISDLVPVTDADIVYEGEFTFGANEEWATIELQTPFVYTGGNIAITINDKTGVSKAYSGYDKFYASTTTEARALYKANYTSSGEILNDASNAGYMNQLTVSMWDATILIPDVQLTIAPLQVGVVVDKEEIAFGTVQVGNYWSENEDVTVSVSVTPIKTSVTNITCDNDFFVLPTLDLTSNTIAFDVTYNKNASAGEYSGNLTITYGDGETKVVPMTATAYEPATADVYEKAQELSFTEGVATVTPDFASLKDDYNLPNEVNNGNTPDAAYEFTLTGDAALSVDVTGTNAVYAIYKAEDLASNGPKADNNFVGEKPASDVLTSFFYDFSEENVMDNFTLLNKDTDTYNWYLYEQGDTKTLKSDSYYNSLTLYPDNYIITKEKYAITAESVVSFKYLTSQYPDKFGVEVSTDGVEFTNIWNDKVASGGQYVEQVVSLSEYAGQELYIALRHYESNGNEGYYVMIDDLKLEDGIPNVFPAGTYYLVAAAEDAFTVTVTAEVEEPVVEGYRLESTVKSDQWSSSTVSYTYSSETSNDVVSFDEGSYRTIVTYNTDGTVANTTYVFMLDGAPDYTSDYTVTEYTYTDGVLTSYTETKNYSWRDPETSEYTLTYNEDGTVAKVTVDNRTYAYEYEDGKLVKETYSYYAEWAGGDYIEYIKEFEYDENGNCVLETQYSLFENEDGETEKTPRKATEFYYDATISNDDVYSFEYPQAVAPAHANVITKTLSYEFQEDYFTGEISKEYFTVTVFNYNPEILATPLAPMDLKANVLSDTEVELSWTSVENGTTFTIYNGTEVVAEGVTETMYTVEGLTAATEYCFTVVSVNGEKVSEASNEACVKTMDLVNVQPSEIAFGVVRLGNYWSEVSSAINVTINPLGKEITAVESDNAFFRIPATIDLTGESVVFSVNYNKSAEAGDYEGNLKVTLSTGDVVTVPMTATAYTPVTPDLFELATEVEFTEGAYENTPDFATLHDDYNLPNETGANPDAVYAFELAKDAVVTASVSANGTYAIYTEDFSGEDGPTAENAFYGNELVLGTSFSYDFENGMADFTIEDNDGNTEYTWAVEEGALKSYSYKGGYDDNGYWVTYCSEADERAITNGSYAITANTVLTFDAKFIDSYGYGVYDKVTVEVTDGESYTEIETIENFMDPATYYPVDGWMEKRVDLGAKFAELGLAYGDYQLVFRHNVSGIGSTQIDNISLTERVNVYPAGKYYLVAAAEEAFTVNLSYEVLNEEPEEPVAKEYRLESIEDYATTVFTYDEVYTNRVVSYEQEGFISTLSYNTNGQLVSVVDTYPGEDADGNPTMDVLSTVTYTYNADGTIATHSEETAGWAPMTTEYVYAEGKLVSTILAVYDMETEFVYNAEGLLSEKVTSYSGEVDSKEVYTYDAEGRVVDYGYYSYDAEDLQDYYLAEGVTYTYDENGDCASAKSYQVFDGEKSYFQTVEYFYDATVANEKVYSFELPHVAAVNVAPAHVSVLAKELSYYTEYNDNGDAVNHTYILTVYNYNPAVVLAPIAPMGLTAEVVEGTVTLTWEAFADAETFTVYQGETVVAENIEESTYEITGLAAGEYCYTVKAVNVKGESTASNTACVTIEGDEPVVEAPAAPENLVATVTGATTITLTWDAVEGATSYNVYGADAVIAEGLTETTYVVEDLAAETAYCFTVTAVGEGGESEESNEACATTEPDGIAENEATFNVYPNPAENVVFVETASNIEAVSIYNITGVMIYSEEGAMNNVQINVADFSAGVYVMKVRTENGEVVKHFVKK